MQMLDKNYNKLEIGDKVLLFGMIGTVYQSEHFKLCSHKPISSTGWMAKSWIAEKTHDTQGQNVVILGKINDGILNKYDTAITPFPCTPDRLLLL